MNIKLILTLLIAAALPFATQAQGLEAAAHGRITLTGQSSPKTSRLPASPDTEAAAQLAAIAALEHGLPIPPSRPTDILAAN